MAELIQRFSFSSNALTPSSHTVTGDRRDDVMNRIDTADGRRFIHTR